MAAGGPNIGDRAGASSDPDLSVQDQLLLTSHLSTDSAELDKAAVVLFKAMHKYKSYREYRQRIDADENSIDIWSKNFELAFLKGILAWRPAGRKKISYDGETRGRNEMISYWITVWTGEVRSRKQVSSHLQVLKEKIKAGTFIARLLFSNCNSSSEESLVKAPNPSALVQIPQPPFDTVLDQSSQLDHALGIPAVPKHFSDPWANDHSFDFPSSMPAMEEPAEMPPFSSSCSIPSIALSAFGIYLTQTNEVSHIQHTFTTLPSTSQQDDMSATEFCLTKKAKFPNLVDTIEMGLMSAPVIFITSSMDLNPPRSTIDQGGELRIDIGLETAHSSSHSGAGIATGINVVDKVKGARSIYANTIFYESGQVVNSSLKEPLFYNSVTNKITGSDFGIRFWAGRIHSFIQQPESATRRLGQMSVTQEVWCSSPYSSFPELLLVVAWEFGSSNGLISSWKCINFALGDPSSLVGGLSDMSHVPVPTIVTEMANRLAGVGPGAKPDSLLPAQSFVEISPLTPPRMTPSFGTDPTNPPAHPFLSAFTTTSTTTTPERFPSNRPGTDIFSSPFQLGGSDITAASHLGVENSPFFILSDPSNLPSPVSSHRGKTKTGTGTTPGRSRTRNRHGNGINDVDFKPVTFDPMQDYSPSNSSVSSLQAVDFGCLDEPKIEFPLEGFLTSLNAFSGKPSATATTTARGIQPIEMNTLQAGSSMMRESQWEW